MDQGSKHALRNQPKSSSPRGSGILPESSTDSTMPADNSATPRPTHQDLRQDAGATPPFPAAFDSRGPIQKRDGAFLPHWTQNGVAYMVTFRLADSLPHDTFLRWQAERQELQEQTQATEGIEKARLQHRADSLVTERIDALLDNGHGACHLKNPAAAKIVADALLYFNDTRYRLWAYCVMPNHVHAVVEPLPGHQLSAILSSWKSFTATAINKLLGRRGEFWQKESFDHAIRNQASFDQKIQYTLDNPKNAGLNDWPWIWRRPPED